MTPAASTALLSLARRVEAAPLSVLYRLSVDYRLPPSTHLADLVAGRMVAIRSDSDPGLTIYPDGAMDVFAPFAWDGSSPRILVRFAGIPLFSVGTPNGPRRAGGIRAATRGSMVHDRLCRSAGSIAAAVGCDPARVYAAADLVLRDVLSEDWSPRWGARYYWAVTRFGDAYRSASIAR